MRSGKTLLPWMVADPLDASPERPHIDLWTAAFGGFLDAGPTVPPGTMG